MKKVLLGLASALLVCAVIAIVHFNQKRRGIPQAIPAIQSQRPVTVSQSPKRPGRVALAEEMLPKYLVQAAEGSSKPTYNVLLQLKTENVKQLVDLYVSQTNLLERGAITWLLGYIGDDQALNVFQNTLFHEFDHRVLGPQEHYIMNVTVLATGLLARHNQKAFQFLVSGIQPKYWGDRITWRTGDTADSVGLLAGTCIQALGMTGRPEIPALLKELKTQTLRNDLDPNSGARTEEGAVVDAAFYHSMISENGMDAFDKFYFNPSSDIDDNNNPYRQWQGLRKEVSG